ncbi:MAG TPA: phosphodiesterase [Gammaproteobacteria bacterium]|nr:phosphodiesterase [Gammaproteobacteria bacterium]
MTMNPIHLIQLTDLHLCETPGDILRSGVNTDEALSALLKQIVAQKQQPDLLVVTGDLVQQPVAAVYERLQHYFSMLSSPVYALCGNHDVPAMASRLLNQGNVNYCGDLLLEKWHLIFLNSSQTDRVDGELSASELLRLEQLLTHSAAQHAMIFLHHPPLKIHSQWMDRIRLKNSEALFAVIDHYPQVRAVVFGHIHQQFESTRGEIRLIGTPATSVQFEPGTDQMVLDALPPAYRSIELYHDGAFNTFIEWLQ